METQRLPSVSTVNNEALKRTCATDSVSLQSMATSLAVSSHATFSSLP